MIDARFKIAFAFLLGLLAGIGVTASVARAAPAPPTADAATGRTTGIGGIFFKAKDPGALQAWYIQHLGLPASGDNVYFEWRDKDPPRRVGSTIWAVFPETTKYFEPTTAPFMVNYRVRDLDRLVAHLRSIGGPVDDEVVADFNGRFTHAVDPEGNRFELWEPKAGY